jgi:class 3 adenylate cyclase
MEEHDIKRKQATIMAADIVGFSRLTANDEDDSLARRVPQDRRPP